MCLCRVVMGVFRGREVSGWRCQFTAQNLVTYFRVSMDYHNYAFYVMYFSVKKNVNKL